MSEREAIKYLSKYERDPAIAYLFIRRCRLKVESLMRRNEKKNCSLYLKRFKKNTQNVNYERDGKFSVNTLNNLLLVFSNDFIIETTTMFKRREVKKGLMH